EGGVLDIAKSDRELWVLRKRGHDRFVLSVWRVNRFEDVSDFKLSAADAPLALLNCAGSAAVLSEKTVRYLVNGADWRVLELKGKLRSGVQVSTASPQGGGTIYVGFNNGEFGGGLQNIDLTTGTVVEIERRDSKNLCSGPLNRECDPVT